MTIAEALVHLKNILRTSPPTLTAGEYIAIKLGQEAIERVHANRQPTSTYWNELLPNETEVDSET